MYGRKKLKRILEEAQGCFLVPCVYDCASARAVEMCHYPAMLLSGGETSISYNGVIDYGFTNLTDIEGVVSRISRTTSIPLIADIDNGFGGPLAVYHAAKRIAAAGAAAIQLEDCADKEVSSNLLPREQYMAKVRAALDALRGSDCLLIARTNADPTDTEQMKEGCSRLQEAIDYGRRQGQYVMAMMVRVRTRKQAAAMAMLVNGPKIFADVQAHKDEAGIYRPDITMDELTPLGFVICTSHFTLKAAMEGMLQHGLENYKNQSVVYTYAAGGVTGVEGDSASFLFAPQDYLALENEFTSGEKVYAISGHQITDYPADKFRKVEIRDRL